MNHNENLKKVEINLFEEKEDRLRCQLYGYFSFLILSKKFASTNSDLIIVMESFGLAFRPYVYKSRTLLLSRVVRTIEKKDKNELSASLDDIVNYLNDFNKNVEKPIEDDEMKKKKKKNIFDDIFNQLS